jgi:hypothetical protein
MEVSESNKKTCVNKKEIYIEPEHVIKQKIWCDKQKRIFYETGRPIFTSFYETNHFFYKKSMNGTYIGLYE